MINLINLLSILLFNLTLLSAKKVLLYSPKDPIEVLNLTSFDTALFGAPKATIIEFFAHWCGHCQRFAPRWKELARDSKAWHEKVIRVAAIDCALPEHDGICSANNVVLYPSFAFFKPFATSRKGIKIEEDMETATSEKFMASMITFVATQVDKKPLNWPQLKPYKSDKLDGIFELYPKLRYALLIFEPPNSFVGRKIILDFSAYTDKLIIRHVTPDENPKLFESFKVPIDTKPVIFVVVNGSDQVKRYQLLDTYIDQLKKDVTHNDVHEEDDHDSDPNHHPTDHKDDLRYIHAKTIRIFIKYTKLLAVETVEKLADDIEEGQIHLSEKKLKAKHGLKHPYENVQMIDLESGINYMIRHELLKLNEIKGEELFALKEWLRVLTQYYPGRAPIRNYLKIILEKLHDVDFKLKSADWERFISFDTNQAYLPETLEFRHCNGSDERYRGYPCSMWTLFHVLTVSRDNMEKQKSKPFEDYDPTELIASFRGYIGHFFGCHECGQNFLIETQNYKRDVRKPSDDVKYLWEVHNKVNKRLAGDVTEDPEFPKIQFPSKEKCPECYAKDTDLRKAINYNESPFSVPDVVNYLHKYYSIQAIEGEKELNDARLKIENARVKEQTDKLLNKLLEDRAKSFSGSVIDTHKTVNETDKPVIDKMPKKTDEVKVEDLPKQIEEMPKNNDTNDKQIVDFDDNSDINKKVISNDDNSKINLKNAENKEHYDTKEDEINRIHYDFKEFEYEEHKSHSLDLLLSFTIYLLILITFCCLYCYFKMLRRRSFSTCFKK